MKKVLVISSGPLKKDGMTQLAIDIIQFNKDMKFAVCSGFEASPYYIDLLRELDVDFYRLSNKKNVILYMVDIYKLIKREKYSVVYIHGNSSMMLFEALPAKLVGTKVVTHCHNTKSNYPVLHKMFKPFFNMLVDVKIGCSRMATDFAYMGKRKKTIINGIDVGKFTFDGQIRNKMRIKLGWNDKKIVGHIGRFTRQKNHLRLIGIFDKMREMDKNVRLLLIGEGELLDDIKNEIALRRIEEYVIIQGFTERPQDYMQTMDIMIMPSLYEGLCLVALEAQANGLPLLLDNEFAPETFVTDQVAALKLKDDDKIWAAQALKMINKGRENIGNYDLIKKMDKKIMMKKIHSILIGI